MKKIYLTYFSVFTSLLTVNAQLSLTKAFNEPASGDISRYKQYDSTATFNRQTGANKVWNYSSVVASTVAPSTEIFTTTVGIPNIPPSLASANLASYNGSTFSPISYSMYKLNTSDYELIGSFTGTNSIETLTNTVIQMSFPFTYGSFFSDAIGGSITSGTTTNLESGTSNVLGSGTGTVILPGNLTFANCLQVKSDFVVSVTTNSPPFVPFVTATITSYSYYHASQKFPIATLTDSKVMAFGQPQNSSELIINGSVIPIGLNELKSDGLTFSIFPNPTKERLFIKNDKALTETTTISVLDINGKILLIETMNANETLNGIDVSSLNTGVYVIQLQNKLGVTHKRFIKE
jgi:hypothetical protein